MCYNPKMDCDLDSTVPDWLIEHPETSVVFERFGIDNNCAGKSLRYLCNQRGLSPPDVLRQLHEVLGWDSTEDRD